MSVNATSRTGTPLSGIDRFEVQDELERILASDPFRKSRRYPSFLRYIVEKTLSGEGEELKERSLGIEVFHRAPDYDTNVDPVVRFSAGEVRRRLAQYYQLSSSRGSIEIRLPTGSYVPLFVRSGTGEGPELPPAAGPAHPVEESRLPDHGPAALGEIVSRPGTGRPSRRGFLSGILAGSLGVSVAVLIGGVLREASIRRSGRTPLMELWSPFLAAPDTVVISVGRTHVDEVDRPEPPNATIEQHILRPDARISLAAVQAVSQLTGFLVTEHKQFRIHEAYSTTLQDLHRRPAILVGGYNNIWTMRLLRRLRFRLEQSGGVHFIVDAQHPERRDWAVDFDTPYLRQTFDYAIIARFHDPTTEGFVVVAAGIGSTGSEAAGEFLVSEDSLETLARSAAHNSLSQNFEAVLRVEVIGGNSGAATVVASEFW